MLLALDTATNTGFAWGGPQDGSPQAGHWILPGGSDPIKFNRSLVQLGEGVTMLVRQHAIERVAIEAALLIMNNEFAAKTLDFLHSLVAVARKDATRAGAAVEIISPRTWRAEILGNGNMPRAQAKAAAKAHCKMLGWAFETEDEAEAQVIWHCAMARNYPQWSPRSTATKRATA